MKTEGGFLVDKGVLVYDMVGERDFEQYDDCIAWRCMVGSLSVEAVFEYD